MQKRQIATRTFIFLFIIIIFPLIVSGFSVREFLEEASYGIMSITSYATTGVTSANLTVSGRNGNIYYVENVSTVTITENSVTNVTVSFYLNDPDGNAANASQARMNLSKSVSPTDYNRGTSGTAIKNYSSSTSGGCFSTNDINTTVTNLSCWTNIWYFDSPGQWNITVSFIELNGSFAAYNDTHNFTLASTTAIQIYPSQLTFPGNVTPGEDNITSNNDPIIINNTGNVDYTTNGSIRINATNLVGEIRKNQTIPAFNFSFDGLSKGYATNTTGVAECKDGNSTSPADFSGNSSFINITNSHLNRGNHSLDNGTAGIAYIYVCLNDAPTSIIGQTYSTVEMGSWVIGVI